VPVSFHQPGERRTVAVLSGPYPLGLLSREGVRFDGHAAAGPAVGGGLRGVQWLHLSPSTRRLSSTCRPLAPPDPAVLSVSTDLWRGRWRRIQGSGVRKQESATDGATWSF